MSISSPDINDAVPDRLFPEGEHHFSDEKYTAPGGQEYSRRKPHRIGGAGAEAGCGKNEHKLISEACHGAQKAV